MDDYTIKMDRDGNRWLARFVTPGGPNIKAYGRDEWAALDNLGFYLMDAASLYGSIDAIPRLPEDTP